MGIAAGQLASGFGLNRASSRAGCTRSNRPDAARPFTVCPAPRRGIPDGGTATADRIRVGLGLYSPSMQRPPPTEALLAAVDPDKTSPVRVVLPHVIAELSEHSGHADTIRESLEDAKTMG